MQWERDGWCQVNGTVSSSLFSLPSPSAQNGTRVYMMCNIILCIFFFFIYGTVHKYNVVFLVKLKCILYVFGLAGNSMRIKKNIFGNIIHALLHCQHIHNIVCCINTRTIGCCIVYAIISPSFRGMKTFKVKMSLSVSCMEYILTCAPSSPL